MRMFVRVWMGVGALTFAGLAAADDKTPREPLIDPVPDVAPAVEPKAAAKPPQEPISELNTPEVLFHPDIAAETAPASATAPELVQRGDLLVVELSPLRPKDWSDIPASLRVGETDLGDQAKAPPTIHVRVGDDGYARFPATDRRLPFAELEAGTLESMLSKHLELHGQPGRVVKVTKRPIPMSLVTVQGMVKNPGVYSLPANATLDDAIAAAGGVDAVVLAKTPRTVTEYIDEGAPGGGTVQRAVPRTVYDDVAKSIPEDRLVAQLQHPHLDIGRAAVGQGASEVQIPMTSWKATRLCIDGVIIAVRPS
ncbi:MAG: SLBB domain-containing protein, partial [Planctomycetaceae bacterium]